MVDSDKREGGGLCAWLLISDRVVRKALLRRFQERAEGVRMQIMWVFVGREFWEE